MTEGGGREQLRPRGQEDAGGDDIYKLTLGKQVLERVAVNGDEIDDGDNRYPGNVATSAQIKAALTKTKEGYYANMDLNGMTDSRDFLPNGPCSDGYDGKTEWKLPREIDGRSLLATCVPQLRGGGGGGRGIYTECDGDFPVTMLGRQTYDQEHHVTTQHKVPEERSGSIASSCSEDSDEAIRRGFVTILKNARSIQTEERFEELTLECERLAWDAVLVNETWRKDEEEVVKLKDGHTWCGSGGTAGKHGVGILLNKRWTLSRFKAISTRLCVLEVEAESRSFRLIATYMPHAGYKDEAVEELYENISTQIKEARKNRRSIILGDDWNSEVQSLTSSAVGRFANRHGNPREEWLANWACKEGLVITNTSFKKRWGPTMDALPSWTQTAN